MQFMMVQDHAPATLKERFEALEQRRLALGVSIDSLSRKADVSVSTYHRALKRSGSPSFRTLAKWKSALEHMEQMG